MTRRRPIGRLWGILWRVALGAIVCFGVAVAAGIIAFYSDWGQDRIRDVVAGKLSAEIKGTLTIGAMDTGLSGRVRARDIDITSPDGRDLVHIDSADININVIALVRGAVHIDTLVIERAVVHANIGAGGRVDLAELVDVERREDRAARRVMIDAFAIRDSRVEMSERGQHVATIVDVDMEGAMSMAASPAQPGTVVTIKHARGRWLEGDLEARVSGQLLADPDMLVAREVEMRVLDSRVFARVISSDRASGRIRATGHAFIASADVVAVCERVRHIRPTAADLCDGLAGTPVPDIHVMATLRHDQGEVPWFVHTWVAGRGKGVELDVDASLHIAATGPKVYGSASGTLIVDSVAEAGGRVKASMEAHATGQTLVARIWGESPRGHGRGWIRAHMEDGLVWFDEVGVRAGPADLAALSTGAVAGRLESLAVDAEGPWNALGARISARLEDLSVPLAGQRPGDRLRIGRARAQINATDVSLFELPRDGTVALTAVNIRYRDRRLGQISVKGRVFERGDRVEATLRGKDLDVVKRARVGLRLRRRDGTIQVNLGRYEVAMGTLLWRGRGGSITAHEHGGVSVREVGVVSRAGRLSVSGSLNRPGRNQLQVSAIGLDLARIGAALGIRHLRGSLTGMWRLRPGRTHWLVRGDADLRRVAWAPDMPRLSSAIHVDLDNERVHAHAHATAGDGQVAVFIDAVLPANPFDPAAWASIEIDQVRMVRLLVRSVNIASLKAMVPQLSTLPVSGEFGGAIELDAAKNTLSLAVQAKKLAFEHRQKRIGPVAFEIDGTWNSERLQGSVLLSHGAEPALSGEFSLAIDLAELWVGRASSMLARVRDAPLHVDLRIDEFRLQTLRRAGLVGRRAVLPPAPLDLVRLSGTVTGRVQMDGSVTRPRVSIPDLSIKDLQVGGVRVDLVTLSGQVEQDGVTASIMASQPGSGRIDASGRYQWAQEPSLEATVDAHRLDLAMLRMLAMGTSGSLAADVLNSLGGSLDAELRVAGSPARPQVTGTLTIKNGQAWLTGTTSRHIHDATVSLEFAPDEVIVRELAAKIDEGSARVTGTIELDGRLPRRFDATVEGEGLAIFTSTYRATIRASAAITGSYQDGTIDTNIRIAEGARVDVDESARALQPLDSLEDVVYVDEQARVARQNNAARKTDMPTMIFDITAPGGIQVIGKEVNVIISPDPRIRLIVKNSGLEMVVGSLESIGGYVSIFDNRYRIERGALTFETQPTNPGIYARLSADFAPATVFVRISGTIDEPEITLSSTPSADETTILAIMLGLDPSESEEALAAGAVSVGTILASKLRSRLPVRVDVARAHPDGFTIGRWITSNLLLEYRYRTTPDKRENANEAILRWRFDPNWLLEGRYGDHDIGGVDILWNYRF